MKKFSIFVLLVLAILLPSITGYCEDRYEYIGKGVDESTFYLDRVSITRTKSTNVFRCWYKNIVSNTVRQRYINSRRDNNIRQKLRQLSYVMYCFEINLAQNTYRGIEEHTYDFKGYLIDNGFSTKNEWEYIPQNSVMDAMSKAIKRIVLSNTSQRMPNAGEFNNSQSNQAKPHSDNIEVLAIVIPALALGAAISVVLVLALNDKPTVAYHQSQTPLYEHNEAPSGTHVEAKHEDTSNTVKDDFDYPYEDIGKVTGL